MLPKYTRVLLKLSGEALMGDKNFGFDNAVIAQYAADIKTIVDLGVQVAIVIGGGNIYRGMNEKETGIERAHGDYMGMLATVINGMAMQAGWKKLAFLPVCKAPSKWNRSPNPISAAALSGTWKRAGWSFSGLVRATLILRPIQPVPCGLLK